MFFQLPSEDGSPLLIMQSILVRTGIRVITSLYWASTLILEPQIAFTNEQLAKLNMSVGKSDFQNCYFREL